MTSCERHTLLVSKSKAVSSMSYLVRENAMHYSQRPKGDRFEAIGYSPTGNATSRELHADAHKYTDRTFIT